MKNTPMATPATPQRGHGAQPLAQPEQRAERSQQRPGAARHRVDDGQVREPVAAQQGREVEDVDDRARQQHRPLDAAPARQRVPRGPDAERRPDDHEEQRGDQGEARVAAGASWRPRSRAHAAARRRGRGPGPWPTCGRLSPAAARPPAPARRRTSRRTTMACMNPVLVEAMRGGIRESAHRGAIAVVDADGTRRSPRSATSSGRCFRARRSRCCRPCRWWRAAPPISSA